MSQPPADPPRAGEPRVDGGVPSGHVVLVLRRDPGVDDLRELAGSDDPALRELAGVLEAFGGPANARLLPRRLDAQAASLAARAERRRPERRRRVPGQFWRIDRRDAGDAADVARRLAALSDVVETAYAEARAVLPVAPPRAPAAPRASAVRAAMRSQRYLDKRPAGVDARFAWTQPGGRGEDVRLVDVEMGWRLTHPAYAAHLPSVLPDPDRVNRDGVGTFVGDHGTATLGVIGATGAGVPVAGIAPAIASLQVCSHYHHATGDDLPVAPAVVQAAARLRAGDVLLLEVQREGLFGLLPTETDLADFEHIRQATDAGIVVVAAAGNGETDIDLWRSADLPERRLADHDPWDSGSVLVGSCVRAVHRKGHRRFPTSNYGARVDCYAWGEGVATATASATDAFYYSDYGGTSSASAIIAGVAVLCESIHRAAHQGRAVAPETLRELLSAPTGVPQKPDDDPDRIGVMPDLAVLAPLLRSAPQGPELPADDPADPPIP